MLLRRLLLAVALLAVAAVAGVALFGLWHSVRSGRLIAAESLAGPDTVALFSLTLDETDPGVVSVLARIRQMDARRKHSKLPPWARWLLAGSTETAASPQAGVVMPVRVVSYLERGRGGSEVAALVVSLSRYSDRIGSALGPGPRTVHRGIEIARPANSGDPYAALMENNVVLAASEGEIRAAIDRLKDGSPKPGALFQSARDAARGGDGFALVLNSGDRLEAVIHGALARRGISAGGEAGGARLVPRSFLACGLSVDLVTADEARVSGEVLFTDRKSARDGERWVRRGVPVALALAGLESELSIRSEGEAVRVSGSLRGLDGLWDRLLAGRVFWGAASARP